MKNLNITIEDIKAVKSLMAEVDSLRENSYQENSDDYGHNFNGKEDLIEAKECKVQQNIKIIAKVLKVDYDLVVDMCYDFEFAKTILSQMKTPPHKLKVGSTVSLRKTAALKFSGIFNVQKISETGKQVDLVSICREVELPNFSVEHIQLV